MWGDSAYQGQSEAVRKHAPEATDFTNRRYRYKKGSTNSNGRRNNTKSSVRAKVEHPLLIIKRIFVEPDALGGYIQPPPGRSGDPHRHQFRFVQYDSGNPIVLSALCLREAVAAAVPRLEPGRARPGGGRRLLTETRARDDRRHLGQAEGVLYAFVRDQWKRLGRLMGRLASRS